MKGVIFRRCVASVDDYMVMTTDMGMGIMGRTCGRQTLIYDRTIMIVAFYNHLSMLLTYRRGGAMTTIRTERTYQTAHTVVVFPCIPKRADIYHIE